MELSSKKWVKVLEETKEPDEVITTVVITEEGVIKGGDMEEDKRRSRESAGDLTQKCIHFFPFSLILFTPLHLTHNDTSVYIVPSFTSTCMEISFRIISIFLPSIINPRKINHHNILKRQQIHIH